MELVKEKLNYLTMLDFNDNYNKTDIERMFIVESDEIKRVKKEIEEILYKTYDRTKYKIRADVNYVTIYKIDHTYSVEMLQVVETIWSDNFRKLPTAWVFGKAVSKKVLEDTLAELE